LSHAFASNLSAIRGGRDGSAPGCIIFGQSRTKIMGGNGSSTRRAGTFGVKSTWHQIHLACRIMRQFLTRLGTATASPAAFAIVAVYGMAWAALGHLDWHGVATLATWLMTLIIQRAEHRDTQALHAKLDELLKAEGRARNELTRLDEKEPEEIEQRRKDEAVPLRGAREASRKVRPRTESP
jgi:low affinity Fe/Cu permease